MLGRWLAVLCQVLTVAALANESATTGAPGWAGPAAVVVLEADFISRPTVGVVVGNWHGCVGGGATATAWWGGLAGPVRGLREDCGVLILGRASSQIGSGHNV